MSGAGDLPAFRMTIFYVVIFGCLILPAAHASRPHPLELGGPESIDAPAANSSSSLDDESKLKLIFCIQPMICVHPAPCYCCVKPEKCWYTETECKLNCLTCNPNCPHEVAALEGRPVNATNSTLY
ncbi:hypothetical protein QOZ80_6BG0497680 [Eleusine coracana subsp. coracana]|nr:hypothetical protein QOZ80_6BG0497680 [Eleusine coracana subsp. coracana]